MVSRTRWSNVARAYTTFNLSAAKITQAHAFSDPIALQGSFDTAPGGWGSGAYPSTQMGVMAYFRQLMYDASRLQEYMMYLKSIDMINPNKMMS